MMKQVPIASADNRGAETVDGNTLGVIGGGRVAAGDVAWSMGDFAFAPGRPGGRAPIVWVPDAGYNFADSNKLKIYHTNIAISKPVKSMIPINPPVAGAALLLHCYDKSSRYFVWFIGSRCFITKNGTTIADFTSAFADAPIESDAYIDSDGNLIWGAAGQSGDIVTVAKYQNGTLQSQRSYSEEIIEAAFESIMRQKLADVSYSATVTPGTPTTQTEVYYSDSPSDGVVYQSNYDGVGISGESYSFDAYASIGVSRIFDFVNCDSLQSIESFGSVYIQAHVAAWSAENGDESYYSGGLVTHLRNVAVRRISDGAIIAELQEQQEPFVETVSAVDYATTVTDATGAFDEERQQYPITRTINQTLCSVEITASLPSINTDTQAAISTDIGNGYVVKNRLKIENVFGWVSPVGWVERSGNPPKKIYDAPQYNKLSGAWRAGRLNTAEALGVAGGKVLTIRQDSVTESTPPIDFSTVVTKRFT